MQNIPRNNYKHNNSVFYTRNLGRCPSAIFHLSRSAKLHQNRSANRIMLYILLVISIGPLFFFITNIWYVELHNIKEFI